MTRSVRTPTMEAVPAAEQLDPAVTEAIARITHELKTPLASILGYSRMLRSGWDSLDQSRREEFFAVVESQGLRLQRMIEDLLQCGRTDSQEMKLRREPVDLAAIVRRTVTTVACLTSERRIDVIAPARDLGLYGDATALEHVFTNLLENAIKYTADGTRIRVLIREWPGEVRVSVTDEGNGIDAADLPHVFDRFRRANGTARGVGLGLHIVRTLVEAHNGRVWAESPPGEGATFTVALPRRTRNG